MWNDPPFQKCPGRKLGFLRLALELSESKAFPPRQRQTATSEELVKLETKRKWPRSRHRGQRETTDSKK